MLRQIVADGAETRALDHALERRKGWLDAATAAGAPTAAAGTDSAASIAAAMTARAEESPVNPVRLGFDTYSIRAFKWKAIQLLDYAAGLKLDTIQLSSLEDYASLDKAYLASVKDHADTAGDREIVGHNPLAGG